jgi:hypothetical protein
MILTSVKGPRGKTGVKIKGLMLDTGCSTAAKRLKQAPIGISCFP